MHDMATTLPPTAVELKHLAEEIYSATRLSFHQRVVSVYRPLYAPFHEMLEWIPLQSRMVDVGCGTGCFLLLADRLIGLEVGQGYDVNAKSIELAHAMNRNPRVQFHVHQSVPAGVIHGATVVTLLDVLHHIPEDEKRPAIRQIIADLPPGARLIIKDLDPKPAWRALANRVTDYLSTRSKVSYIALADVVAILQESGLKIRVAKRCNRHVWSHFFVVADKVSA